MTQDTMGESDAESSAQEVPERSPAPMPDTVVDVADPESRLSGAEVLWLREHGSRVIEALRARGELRVLLVGDEQMAREHAEWLDDPTTTDVLTFDLREDTDEPLDTDLIVCVDQARREAESLGHDLRSELLLYMVHGLLHCLGYDDQTPEQAAAMHAEEDRVLEAIGVGAVFRTGNDSSAHTTPGVSS